MDGPHDPVAFDRYVLDPRRRRLLRDGEPVVLQAKAFDLLAILVGRAAEAVSRNELYELLWPGAAVEDGNLTQHVYLLRRALDPEGSGRGFIETLPRYGYRFSKPVAVPVPAVAAAPTALTAPPRARRFGRLIASVALAAAVAVVPAPSGTRSRSAPLNSNASTAYALGVYHLNMRSVGNLRHSVAYFERTVREAPRSALGYAGLASAYGLEAEFEREGSPAFRRYAGLARRFRDEALARDRGSAEARTVAAWVAYRFDGDRARAERDFRLALAADPRNATARHWHAILLLSQRDIDGALREWELAHQLDPTSEVITRWLGRAYYYRRRPDDAARAFAETLAIAPQDAPARLGLAASQEARGRLRDALGTLASMRRLRPDEDAYVIPNEARIRLLLHGGNADHRTVAEIDRLAAQGRLDGVEAALFYVTLGSRDRALAVLRASRPRSSPIALVLARLDPRFDTVRGDPRFGTFFE